MVKFSPANSKTEKLYLVDGLKPYLANDRKVVSFDLLSGWSCPGANDCLAKVQLLENGKRRLIDGPNTKFRCFSASQEVIYTGVYNLRKANFDEVKGKDAHEIFDLLDNAMPKDTGIVRIHVAGDFFNQQYFLAWLAMAEKYKGVLFYAYTKYLPAWLRNVQRVNKLGNFVLTASYGGVWDNLIAKHNLRFSKVVFSEKEAYNIGLELDQDDSHAANPEMKFQSFALLLHGVQPQGSEASLALSEIKRLAKV